MHGPKSKFKIPVLIGLDAMNKVYTNPDNHNSEVDLCLNEKCDFLKYIFQTVSR